jgi:predicted amidophosphoribosyltransferase
VRRTFCLAAPASNLLIADKHILLIDDVMTTGAKINNCAQTLLAAGAGRVSALVFARVV